jgi:HlyD family secretion protein
VLAVPFSALPSRPSASRASAAAQARRTPADSAVADTTSADKVPDVEGAFVVEKGVAHFRPVRVGIAGQSHFVVLSGLKEGEQVVAGPFKTVSDLRDGERVKIKRDTERKRGS